MLGATEVPPRLRRYPSAPLLHALNCGLDCTFTSVAGYLFDAVAGLLDVESAAALEDLAARHGPVEPLSWGYALSSDGELDFLPLLEDLVDVDDAALGAALFHATFAQGVAEWILRAAAAYDTRRVALAGDCFENRVLAGALGTRLHRAGCEVYAPFTQQVSARAALRGVRTIDVEASA
jgi:hydrogenase maturation protein HypF